MITKRDANPVHPDQPMPSAAPAAPAIPAIPLAAPLHGERPPWT
ncbi:MAG: hypothetical protein ACE5EI_04050 [Thermodesulfobacteriota bacterium]